MARSVLWQGKYGLQVIETSNPDQVLLEVVDDAKLDTDPWHRIERYLYAFSRLREIDAEAAINGYLIPRAKFRQLRGFLDQIWILAEPVPLDPEQERDLTGLNREPDSVPIHYLNEHEVRLLFELVSTGEVTDLQSSYKGSDLAVFFRSRVLEGVITNEARNFLDLAVRYLRIRDGVMHHGDAVIMFGPDLLKSPRLYDETQGLVEFHVDHNTRGIPPQFTCPVPFPATYFDRLFPPDENYTVHPIFNGLEVKLQYLPDPDIDPVYFLTSNASALKITCPDGQRLATLTIYFFFADGDKPTEADILDVLDRKDTKYWVNRGSGAVYVKISGLPNLPGFYLANPESLPLESHRLSRIRAGFVGWALAEALVIPVMGLHIIKFQDLRLARYDRCTEMALTLARSLVARRGYDAKFTVNNYIYYNAHGYLTNSKTSAFYQLTDYAAYTKIFPRWFGVPAQGYFKVPDSEAKQAATGRSLARCFPLACLSGAEFEEAMRQDVWATDPATEVLEVEHQYLDCLQKALIGGNPEDMIQQLKLPSLMDQTLGITAPGSQLRKELYPSIWCLYALATGKSSRWLDLMVRVVHQYPDCSVQSRVLAGGLLGAMLGWENMISNRLLADLIGEMIKVNLPDRIGIYQLLDLENLVLELHRF